MKKLKDLCKWEVFHPGGGYYYVVVNPEDNFRPITALNETGYYHWAEFPEYVEVIGMMFLKPDNKPW